ncbi:MAG TPA: 3-methyladenine DNA glycosylase [Micromonosporaceae bacterium]
MLAEVDRRPTVLAERDWRARREAHQGRVDAWLGPHLARRREGRQHPVEDFLFTYYSYRPAALRRWHPGPGVLLIGARPEEFGPGYRAVDGGVELDTASVFARRRDSVGWIRRLLVATAARPAHFGCFGMHEWAMVYRLPTDRVRHATWPLRMDPDAVADVVDRVRVRCSHFDAYRFFTPAARPLNQLRPTRETQIGYEQPGCLHANMDLYRYSYKLAPLVDSELIADCFALACDIRTLDMRASPYDLSALGYPPVPVETPQGRAEYAAAQRAFAERAAPLRGRLVAAIDRAVALAEPSGAPTASGTSPEHIDRAGDHQRDRDQRDR